MLALKAKANANCQQYPLQTIRQLHTGVKIRRCLAFFKCIPRIKTQAKGRSLSTCSPSSFSLLFKIFITDFQWALFPLPLRHDMRTRPWTHWHVYASPRVIKKTLCGV